jgi:phosphatidylinositol glycan class O
MGVNTTKSFLTFKKAIFFVIDSLRIDFITSVNPGNDESGDHPLLNMRNTILNCPKHAKLFTFRADPPTVTSQRLNGLMTGSLPTFVDVSSNLQSSNIVEDNLIHQLRSIDKK